jgi:hypothetical protein
MCDGSVFFVAFLLLLKLMIVLTLVLLSENGFGICGRCDRGQVSENENENESDVLFHLKRVGQLNQLALINQLQSLSLYYTCIINFAHFQNCLYELKK